MPVRFAKFSIAVAVGLGAAHAAASDPSGVFLKAQKVELEPNGDAPKRIVIRGAAMLYNGDQSTPYPGYSAPALGFLYYECPAGKDCSLEWADVLKNASDSIEKCIGIGSRSLPPGTLRAPDATVANPDAYPINIGIGKGFTPCEILKKFLLGGSAGAGGTAGTAGMAGL